MTDITTLPKDISERLRNIRLPAGAAFHKMTTKVPVVSRNQTIAEVRQLLIDHPKKNQSINYIYVLGKNRKLVGVLSIKEVFLHKPEELVRNVMVDKIIKTHPETDQEKVAHLAVKNNIKAVPLVDASGRLIGVVPSDAILNILDQETKEDFLRLSGIIPRRAHLEAESSLPVFTSFVHRVPWILVGLIGGLFIASVIDQFEVVLKENLILAAFIPLVVYLANAVGVQSQTLFIRDLATSQTKIVFSKYSLKEIFISTLTGLACWLTIFVIIKAFWQEDYIGFVVGMAIFGSIIAAVFFALLIPYLLNFFKKDPAIGSGPFTTIIQDLISVLIYFIIASALL